MKKSFVVVCVLALLVGSLTTTAEAGKKKKKRIERTAEGSYATPGFGTAITGGAAGCSDQNAFGCVVFTTTKAESYIKVEVTDATGQPVAGSVTQDLNGDNAADTSSSFCGKTNEAVPITAGTEVNVFIWTGPCEDGSQALATRGTVKATLSNRP